MRKVAMILGAVAVLGACKREEVTASGKRELTMRDENLVLDADNDARFGQGRMPAPEPTEAPESPFVAEVVPDGWTTAPGSAFRLLNYKFGTAGEAYLSISRGGVLENVNRWLGQFDAEAVDQAGLEAMESVDLAGHQGVWVKADGNFGGAMGKQAQEAWSLRGVVTEGPKGLVTVKLLGPTEEVKAEEERLRAFVGGLRLQK
ncbi:hypothetical protein [Haloferula rosea]|uniref:Lipoprotein n=1 Tax=Haloferula rosea TaxID=490093 RepID=A0A934VEV1_9BACT|nr:hypothetical protein [Haloferula rosea]MBK1825905.1 hypothetical protein [Haloferula rosea]